MSPSKSLELSGRGEGVTKLRVVFARRMTKARPFLLTLVEAILWSSSINGLCSVRIRVERGQVLTVKSEKPQDFSTSSLISLLSDHPDSSDLWPVRS